MTVNETVGFKKTQGGRHMNKSELVAAIAKETGHPKNQTEVFLNAFMKAVKEAVAKKDEIQLIGFGSFGSRENKARDGINPQTKKPIKIKASRTPIFKAGKSFKEALNA